jgi:hypothetical protein
MYVRNRTRPTAIPTADCADCHSIPCPESVATRSITAGLHRKTGCGCHLCDCRSAALPLVVVSRATCTPGAGLVDSRSARANTYIGQLHLTQGGDTGERGGLRVSSPLLYVCSMLVSPCT